MLCTTAINTSNTTRTHGPVPVLPAERHSSGRYSNSCYRVFNYSTIDAGSVIKRSLCVNCRVVNAVI